MKIEKTTYTIVKSQDVKELELFVNALLKAGYTPLGGIATHNWITKNNEREHWFFQAMTLTEIKLT